MRDRFPIVLLACCCVIADALFAAPPPPTPGPESWTFREELARPVPRRPRAAYRLDDRYGLVGDLETVRADLVRFLAAAPGEAQKRLVLRKGAVAGRESYRVEVAADGTATLTAEDDDGLRRAVYWFEDRDEAGDLQPCVRKPWLRHRISRCYFAPIKRPPFNRDELADDVDYYPDEYLNRLAHEGVNGLWLSVELRDLVGTSFNARSPEAPRRLMKLRQTVDRCRRYGIAVWPFLIEPRFMPDDDPLLRAHPEVASPSLFWDVVHLTCPSSEAGLRYIEEALADLFRQVPGLPGVLNISHGERPTTCLSTVSPVCGERSPCPVCARLAPWQIHARTASAFVRGMRSVNPSAEFLSWFYQPHVTWERAKWVPEVAAHLPEGVTMLYNFESGALKEQLGRTRSGGDYWLSCVGPASGFARVADSAREAGGRIGAKIQVGCSHECATVPYVPVPGLLYRKYRAMRDAGCSTVMQCWYFGNCPGVMNKAAGELAFEDFATDEKSFLLGLARPQWGDSAEAVANVWMRLSDAYANYPLSNDMQYYGPFHAGVVWPLEPDVNLRPLGRTWKPHDPPSGDAIGECLENHTLDEACILAERMADGADCRAELDRLTAAFAGDAERRRDLGVMRALGLLFRSGADILEFYRLRAEAVVASRVRGDANAARRALARMRERLTREQEVSAAMLELARADSRLGFHSEAESHQFFPAKLEWRRAELDRAKSRLDEIDGLLSAGKPYPLSRHEQASPVFPQGEWVAPARRFQLVSELDSQLDVHQDGRWIDEPARFRFMGSFVESGDFVLQGEVRESACEAVTVRTMDLCGIAWHKALTVRRDGTVGSPSENVVTPGHEVRSCKVEPLPEGWRFALVLDARGWGGDMARRPAWIGFWNGDAPVWPEVDPPREGRLNIGNWSPDRLGRILAFPRAAAHCHYERLPLEGAWQMAYRPQPWEDERCPSFTGVRVERAVPGYWEDLLPALRAAGLRDEVRVNPEHVDFSFPMTGWANDTTLPNPYGCFLYRRTFVTERIGPAALAFDCVRNQVGVWINGRFVASRQGFSTPFELTVPEGVLRVGTNDIVLAVANVPNRGYDGREVSGMLTRSIYGATGGIDGRVELRFPTSDLQDVCVTTAPDLKTFAVRVVGNDRYRYEILDGVTVKASGEATGDVVLPTAGYAFWSPEYPKRYTLRLTDAKGRTYEQLFGLRRLTPDGERLKLNGRPVYLRGVTEHGYFARTVHVPRDVDYWRMVTRKRKELGFNFVRFHTFVPPVEYLEATDELGMLVHIETPNFVPLSEYAAVVAFARRHPSVVIYCTGNETRIDCQAEEYLKQVAALVHRETDALFSPMSALRGIEYFLVEGKDPYVNEPLPHNRERITRMSRHCDLYNSYQLGVASYCSLNKGSSAELDAWGDAYCGRPRLSHETCIDSTYVDFSLEKLYPPDSPLLKVGLFDKPREYLRERGLLDRADRYYRNSCEWMRRIRKFTFEKLRAADRVAGFDFLGDINTHWHTFGYSVGMMDEFYRLKPGETVENVLRYNSAAVLLADLGSDFNVTAGTKKTVTFSLSNYEADAPAGCLTATLVDAANGERVSEASASWPDRTIPDGRVSPLKPLDFLIPESARPRKYLLKAAFAGGSVVARNEWEIYAFPKVPCLTAPTGVRVVDDISEKDLVAAMANGERVLLLGAGPFRSLPTTFRIGMAGRCSGNYATVVREHSALADFPHEGYCGWQFRRLMEDGRAVQLEAGVPFDPIVDVASAVKCAIRQAALFEYRIGRGRLLVCSFRFTQGDPAAAWLKQALMRHAASAAFQPAQELTPGQLHAVLNAPLVCGEENTNFARNANDPASVVSDAEGD